MVHIVMQNSHTTCKILFSNFIDLNDIPTYMGYRFKENP